MNDNPYYQNWLKISFSRFFIAYLILCIANSAQAQFAGLGANNNYAPLWLSDCKDKLEEYRDEVQAEPWQNALPLFGKKLRQAGYRLPLPMGVGINAIVMSQTNEIKEFSLLIGSEDIPYELQFYNMQSNDANVTFRPDIWLLPFLNIYGVFGYTRGDIQPSILIPGITYNDPILGEIVITETFVISDRINYEGSTVGVGLNAAGGFKNMFFTLDYNYTISEMNLLDDPIIAHTISPRIGVTMEAFKTIGTGVFYIGAMYLAIDQRVSGRVNLREIAPDIADIIGDEIGYSMNLGVKDPVNFLIGGGWQINRRMNLMLEAGVGDRSQFMVGFDYRF